MNKLIITVMICIGAFLSLPLLFILFSSAFEAWQVMIKNIF